MNKLITIFVSIAIFFGCAEDGGIKRRKKADKIDKEEKEEDNGVADNVGDEQNGEEKEGDKTVVPEEEEDPDDIVSIVMDSAPVLKRIPTVAGLSGVLYECQSLATATGNRNPYFAGVTKAESLTYNVAENKVDDTTKNSPADIRLLDPECVQEGSYLFFRPNTTANIYEGSETAMVPHYLGEKFGKSDIIAPEGSVIGLFIGADDPSTMTAPDRIDFSSPDSRNFSKIIPKIGQLFFIGNGKSAAGKYQKFIVPPKAKRLYLAKMSGNAWNAIVENPSFQILMQGKEVKENAARIQYDVQKRKDQSFKAEVRLAGTTNTWQNIKEAVPCGSSSVSLEILASSTAAVGVTAGSNLLLIKTIDAKTVEISFESDGELDAVGAKPDDEVLKLSCPNGLVVVGAQ